MSRCLLNQAGEPRLHRNMTTAPDAFLHAMAPYRQGSVVAVACLFPWSGLADRCAREGSPCVRGHALSMPAIHCGTATHDPIAAHQMAQLVRGGMLPQASVSPATRRATRD
jgi:hypothetical protein